MDFRLSDAERLLQETARRFAEREVAPRAAALDRGAPFPADLMAQAGLLGLLGLPYDPADGGAGAGYLGLGMVVEQAARASMAVAAMISIHHLAAESVARAGTAEQRRRYLRPLASGQVIGALAFTEAATGSNPRQIATRAEPEPGGGWRLRGEKTMVSMGAHAGVCIIFAQEEAGLSAFAAELPAEGFSAGPAWEAMGAHGLPTHPVAIDGLLLPPDARLGAAGDGFGVLLDTIANGKTCVAFQAVGVAQRALELSADYAAQRQAQGAAINRMPSIQWLLAEMAVRVEAARWLAYRCMAARTADDPARREGAMAKLFCSRAAVETVDMAMQVHGAYGYLGGAEIERLYRDAKLTEIYEGTSELQRVIVARGLMN